LAAVVACMALPAVQGINAPSAHGFIIGHG
jgi:hypothetical protein